MTFTPVSCMCLYHKRRIFATESVDELTSPKYVEVMKVVMGTKLKQPRINVSSAEEPSYLPLVEKTADDLIGNTGQKIPNTNKKVID